MLYGKASPLPVRGFNLCESILRHTPDWFAKTEDGTPWTTVLAACEVLRQGLPKPDAELLRDFVSFARAHRDHLDPILIAWYIAQFGSLQIKITFRDLSPMAEDFFRRRKLWDFMEDIPLTEDPAEVCGKVIDELINKGETVYE